MHVRLRCSWINWCVYIFLVYNFNMSFFPYDLRKGNTLHFPWVNSTRNEITSLLFGGILFWNNFPKEIKEKLSTKEFKKRHRAPLCFSVTFNPLRANPHKMVKNTQTIRQQFADELFECVCPFCEIGA